MGLNWKRGASEGLTALGGSMQANYERDKKEQLLIKREDRMYQTSMKKAKELSTWKTQQDKILEADQFKLGQDRLKGQVVEAGYEEGSEEYTSALARARKIDPQATAAETNLGLIDKITAGATDENGNVNYSVNDDLKLVALGAKSSKVFGTLTNVTAQKIVDASDELAKDEVEEMEKEEVLMAWNKVNDLKKVPVNIRKVKTDPEMRKDLRLYRSGMHQARIKDSMNALTGAIKPTVLSGPSSLPETNIIPPKPTALNGPEEPEELTSEGYSPTGKTIGQALGKTQDWFKRVQDKGNEEQMGY